MTKSITWEITAEPTEWVLRIWDTEGRLYQAPKRTEAECRETLKNWFAREVQF